MTEPQQPLQDLWTTVDDSPMYARTNAAAQPDRMPVVVLVHGLVISSAYMVSTALRLAALCRVYAPDLPGYGRSGKPRAMPTLAALADALAAWMDAVRIGRAHFVANSFGCQVLAEFALRHPDRVARMVFQGPTVDPQARTLWRQAIALQRNSRGEAPGLGAISRRDYRAAGLRRAWHTIRLALDDRIEDKLPRIACPLLVVRGTRDPVVPHRWAEQVARLAPQGRLREMPDAPHTINYSRPAEFVDLIAPFLGLHRRTAP